MKAFTEKDLEFAYKYYVAGINCFEDETVLLDIFQFIHSDLDFDEINSFEDFKFAFRKLQVQKLEIEGIVLFFEQLKTLILNGNDISLGKAIELVRNDVEEIDLNDVGSIHIAKTFEYLNK